MTIQEQIEALPRFTVTVGKSDTEDLTETQYVKLADVVAVLTEQQDEWVRCNKCDQPIGEEVLCGDCLYERDGPTSGAKLTAREEPKDVQCANEGHCPCDISTRHEWFIAFCEEREKLRALPVAGGGKDWQPIETAPKEDGVLVLLHPSRCWSEDANSDCEVGYWDDDMQDWLSASGSSAEDYTGPTHWMPLPPSPKADDRG